MRVFWGCDNLLRLSRLGFRYWCGRYFCCWFLLPPQIAISMLILLGCQQ